LLLKRAQYKWYYCNAKVQKQTDHQTLANAFKDVEVTRMADDATKSSWT
jgi:hypothetical protein